MITARRLILLFFILLSALSGWLGWRYLTARSAGLHPFYADPGFTTIAHRGGAGINPENTLEAFIHADKLGVDILEMDLRMTRDHQLVVIHDKTLDRTTNCKGQISQLNWEDLLHCQIIDGTIDDTSDPNRTLRIPTLELLFQHFPTKRMVIELKDGTTPLVAGFCKLIRQYGKESQILVGSFSQSAMDEFRQTCPRVATSATPRETLWFFLLAKTRLARLTSLPATALQLPWRFTSGKKNSLLFFDIVTPSLIRQAHQMNLAVQVWTVNESEDMEYLLALNVDGIMTDYPNRLVSVTRRLGSQ